MLISEAFRISLIYSDQMKCIVFSPSIREQEPIHHDYVRMDGELGQIFVRYLPLLKLGRYSPMPNCKRGSNSYGGCLQ